MADILCRKCLEPWDSWGVNTTEERDMSILEATRFRRGEGCPSCNFGQEKQKLLTNEIAGLEAFILTLDEATDDDEAVEALYSLLDEEA